MCGGKEVGCDGTFAEAEYIYFFVIFEYFLDHCPCIDGKLTMRKWNFAAFRLTVAAGGDSDDGTALAHFADEIGEFVDISIFAAMQQHKRPGACTIPLIINFGIGGPDLVASRGV